MTEPPVIRGDMVNLIWESVYKMIFNDKIDPPLTFEEVHIIQYRLDEHVESNKARLQLKWMIEEDKSEERKTAPEHLYK